MTGMALRMARGAEVDSRDKIGCTPLCGAAA
jgi:hypothetical protein